MEYHPAAVTWIPLGITSTVAAKKGKKSHISIPHSSISWLLLSGTVEVMWLPVCLVCSPVCFCPVSSSWHTQACWTFISKCLVQHFSVASGLCYSTIDAAIWAQWGHNGGVHMVCPSLSLSVFLLRGQTADPRGVKGLRQLHFHKQTHSWPARVTPSTGRQTHTQIHIRTYTHMQTNNTHNSARAQRNRWSLSGSDRFHSATLYLQCGISGATMAFDNSQRATTMTSNFGCCLTTMGLSLPQSLCHSSAWSLRQSSVTEVPIELEQSLTKESLTWCSSPLANCTTYCAVCCEGELASYTNIIAFFFCTNIWRLFQLLWVPVSV